MNKNAFCEVKQNGQWMPMPVPEAISLEERGRCPERHGRVRLHRKGDASPAHFEHYPKFTGCSCCYRFDGKARRNPDALR